jgi:hypothetical protein
VESRDRKESLKFKELEHVLIEKVEQLFRDMLSVADVGRAPRGQWRRRGRGPAVQAAAAAGDWLRRIGHGKAKAGRPGATVKLKNVKTAFAACDVGTKRSPFLILLVLILLARLGLEMGRPKNRNPFRSSPPGFPVVQQEANAPYNSLRADDGCPFMEHGRYSDTIENVVTTQLQEGTADGKPWHFHAMLYGARNIWGVTAGILRNLDERLYS